jgi:hypothetical protein
MAVAIRVEGIVIEQTSVPIVGGGQQPGKATVTVIITGIEQEAIKLTFRERTFVSLDDLVGEIRREIRKFGEELAQASGQTIL